MLVDSLTMTAGAQVKNEDGSKFTGAAVYDIAGSTLSQPKDGATIMRFIANRAFRLPAALPNSVGESKTAPAAQTIYSVQKNDVEIGTMTYGAGANSATFSLASDTDFAVGDVFSVVAPSTADASHNDLHFTFAAELL